MPNPALTPNDLLFDPGVLEKRVLATAWAENLRETERALSYAKEKHRGQFRKKGPFTTKPVPYFLHPLTMAAQALAMGIRDDKLLAAALLHDVCEDCGVAPEELPFSEGVRHTVALLTKHREAGESEEDMDRRYYPAIGADPAASLVKLLDRCNNVSLMALAFSRKKLMEYIRETEAFSLPLLAHCKMAYPQYGDAYFLLEYQIRSILETVKALLQHCGEF